VLDDGGCRHDVDEYQHTGSMGSDQDIPNPDGQLTVMQADRQAGYMKDGQLQCWQIIVKSHRPC